MLHPVRANFRYVALSYVWGIGHKFRTEKKNIHNLLEKGGLSGRMAQVIEDAMELVKQIGERYLWVRYFPLASEG